MSKLSVPAVTADQMREVDRLMVEEYNISLEEMMENAGRNLADLTMEILNRKGPLENGRHVVVACGTGNNGGGGMVATRFLFNRGLDLTVVLAGEESRLKTAPAQRWRTLKRLPVTALVANGHDERGVFAECDLIIDAIFGYGLRDTPKGTPARVISEIVNSGNTNVLSLDVPSGLDSTDGSFGKACIRAMATVTLALPKTGLREPKAKECVGDLFLADIGVPPSLYKHLGLPPQYLFTQETILPLNPIS
ncbi:MAG: NAD(P)H-hydrate epimerase [Candidatus Neomarinimicrobiota bacterium]